MHRAATAAGILALVAAAAPNSRPVPRLDLAYEVVDGLAIHDGDIVLGTAAAVRAPRPAARSQPERRELALPYYGVSLWPEGKIPYVLDATLTPEVARLIEAAIDEWNRQTVVALTPRASETDYVRFIAVEQCAAYSQIGRIGGEQFIWSGFGEECGPRGLDVAIHEIGHTVGLAHEHQRSDRDEYVTVTRESVEPHRRNRYTLSAPANPRPYDLRSVMHYWTAFKSIPPGIEVATGGLSDGDIDGVARLYGHAPEGVTIATNPPGLTVLVDGAAAEAPARFDWPAGTAHTVEVPAEPQYRPGSRYLFGRWNDGAPRRRTVTAGEDGTWLEANFIAQRRVDPKPDRPAAGRVSVTPASDGWHTLGSRVRIEATASGRNEFMNWSWAVGHGPAANPAERAVGEEPISITAYFTRRATYRLGSNAGPFIFELDGARRLGPLVLSAPPAGRRARAGIAETQPMIGRSGTRLRFQGWSDGVEDRDREITIPPSGGALAAIFSTEHPLWLAARPEHGGAVSAGPGSEDGYYATGTGVTVNATPNAGWELARWTGDAGGTSPATVAMDRPSAIEAWFTPTRQIRPASPETVTLPTGAAGFRFAAPEGASGIALKFTPDGPAPGTEVRVRAFSSPREPGLAAWERLHARTSWERERLRDADFAATAEVASAEVSISPYTDPPLDPDALYFVVLVSDGSPVSGTLSLEVTASGPRPPRANAWPRAFTFVSDAGTDPAAQTFELRNEGGSAMQFDAASEAAWLAADPPQGSIPPGGTAELAILVTGQIPADTHAATLDLSLDGPYGALPRLRLPVTFVAVPPPAATPAE